MRPREKQGLRLEKGQIDITPSARIRWIRDIHDNNIGLVDFQDGSDELVITAEFIVDVSESNPFDFIISNEATQYPFSYQHDLQSELFSLSQNIYFRDMERLRAWLDPFWHPGKVVGTLELLQEINTSIFRTFRYRRREEKGVQSPAETLEKGSGSCRDFAAFFMEVCRLLGLAARFVSGYMYSSEITGRMSMHAWAEVFLPGAGWIGFDPSWGILAASQYVPSAVSRHPEQATPISGTYVGTARVFLKSTVDLYVKQVGEPSLSEIRGGQQREPALR